MNILRALENTLLALNRLNLNLTCWMGHRCWALICQNRSFWSGIYCQQMCNNARLHRNAWKCMNCWLNYERKKKSIWKCLSLTNIINRRKNRNQTKGKKIVLNILSQSHLAIRAKMQASTALGRHWDWLCEGDYATKVLFNSIVLLRVFLLHFR